VAGVLLVLLLAGHDATMAAAPHDALAGATRTSTPASAAPAPADHHLHVLTPTDIEAALAVPIGQPCITDRPSLVPPGSGSPDRALAAPVDIRVLRAPQSRETVPEAIAPLPAAVRRALLQVYRN
jgi:hypothetical protein